MRAWSFAPRAAPDAPMAIHTKTLTTERIATGVWLYSGAPADAPAFHHRLDYDANCSAIWTPRKRHAYIEGLSLDCFGPLGCLVHEDYMDIMEGLYEGYGVEFIEWDRADGKKIKKRRVGPRRWVACR